MRSHGCQRAYILSDRPEVPDLYMRTILAIETSCDETAAAIVRDGRAIVSNVVASQIELHRRFGGVFPELASREHVRVIGTVVQDAIDASVGGLDGVEAVAVTHGPGLAGSLLVGVNAAKGIALGRREGIGAYVKRKVPIDANDTKL